MDSQDNKFRWKNEDIRIIRRCNTCNEFVPLEDITYTGYAFSKAICDKCLKKSNHDG